MTKKKFGRPPLDYLIDVCIRGNGIRLYFGSAVEPITGDDFDDVPYEHNAGIVYSEYVNFYMDALIPFNWQVTDPAGELDCYTNSQYCRNDFKTGEIPLFWTTDNAGERDNVYFHMGDLKTDVEEKLDSIGAISRIYKKT